MLAVEPAENLRFAVEVAEAAAEATGNLRRIGNAFAAAIVDRGLLDMVRNELEIGDQSINNLIVRRSIAGAAEQCACWRGDEMQIHSIVIRAAMMFVIMLPSLGT